MAGRWVTVTITATGTRYWNPLLIQRQAEPDAGDTGNRPGPGTP